MIISERGHQRKCKSRLAFVGLTSILVLGTTIGEARADSAEQERALALFEKGRKLARDGRCVDAIAPLLESIRYAEGVGPLLNLGNCYETLGKSASAHKYFVRAQEVAAAHDDRRRDEAVQRARAIEKDVSSITVHVPVSIRNVAEVRIDGESVPKDHWDLPTPVDPGPHEIEVVAPPNPKQTETVTVRPKGDRVEWMAPAPAASSGSERWRGLDKTSTTLGARPEETPSSTQRTLGMVIGGAGVVGLTVGGIFGVISLSAHSSVTGQCPTYPRCSTADRATLDGTNQNATNAGTISTISVIAGALLLIGGAALYFTAPSASSRPARTAR